MIDRLVAWLKSWREPREVSMVSLIEGAHFAMAFDDELRHAGWIGLPGRLRRRLEVEQSNGLQRCASCSVGTITLAVAYGGPPHPDGLLAQQAGRKLAEMLLEHVAGEFKASVRPVT